jgi:acetolactate synthase-1/2/3 large subunit
MTGKVGVALSTLGPGATNLLTGVAYAQLGGFPLLVITGQKAIKKNKQGKFQIVDIVAMMKPITKFSATITSSKEVSSIVAEAISLAERERAGAVHLELPEDIASESCNADIKIVKKINYPVVDEKTINQAVLEIEKSKHPIAVLGRGANNKSISKELELFIKKTGIPFIFTQMGKGAFDENSEFYIGTTALSAGDYVHQALNHADTIILIGHDVVEKPPFISDKNSGKKIIHINYFSSVAPEVYVPTHNVIGDISKTLSAFTDKIKINSAWDFSYFFKVRDMLKKDIAKFSQSSDFPLRPERIVSDINKIISKDDILALDNGMYKLWVARNFVTEKSNSILLDNTLATMGAGLPSGIALKIIFPDRKILVVAGDGGIMMSIGELETAVRLKLDLVVLVLDDSGFGMIRWKQKNMNLSSFGLSFNNPDFIRLAESFGAVGHKVEKIEDLALLLKKAFNSKGVHIITCPINYDEANKVLGTIKNI